MPCSITLINHATVLIQLDGVNILTDPIYSNTISFFIPRLKKPGIAFRDLPPIHVIFVSHSDYDHLNLRTLRKLSRHHLSTIIVPRGLAPYARRAGFSNIVELQWAEDYGYEDMRIVCVPAKHTGTRMFFDKSRSLACGYMMTSKTQTIYFSGDTGYDSLFQDLAAQFSVDVALLPIGAYQPYEWFKHIHLNPETALQAFRDLEASHLVPFHWGTFKISDEPMKEPPLLLAREAERLGIAKQVHILENGESFHVP